MSKSKPKKSAKKQPRKPARAGRRVPVIPTPPPPADPLDAVTAALDAWYYPEIRALAAETLGEARRLAGEGCGSGDLRDKAEEWLRQTLDGHAYVIYTYQSQLAVAASAHSEDWQEALGEDAHPDYAQRAYYAILGDAWERVESDLDALVNEVESREAGEGGDAPDGAGGEGEGES